MSIRNNINLLYKIRFPFLLLALIALLTGIWSGLQRVGWQFSFHPGISPVTHGPLMVSGFLGTLICLERAVALNRFWGYLAPLSSAAGALFILLDSGKSFGPLLIVLSSIFLLLILMRYLLRTRELHFVIMTIGPLLWLVGNILWLTKVGFYQMTPWWAGFLIFTIAGERLELNRVMRLTRAARALFLICCSLMLLGMILTAYYTDWGFRMFSLGMLLLSAWLLRFDIVRVNIFKRGLTRFVGIALLLGYIWLGIAALIGLVYGVRTAGPIYDAFLHSIFLGFVFSMIFGHAPIIFPAILKKSLNFYPIFYLHLAILHLSLVLRIIGDLYILMPLRVWGSLFNALAIILFLGVTILSIIRTSLKKAEAAEI